MNRGTFAVAVLAAIGVVTCALWAFRPPPGETGATTVVADAGERAGAETPRVLAIDERVFQATLWSLPPEPAAPAPAPKAEPRRNRGQRDPGVQLVGIIDEGDAVRRAAFYLPKENRIVIAAVGADIGGFTVTAITEDGVGLSDGTSSRILALRETQ